MLPPLPPCLPCGPGVRICWVHRDIIRTIAGSKAGVLLTTYDQVRLQRADLLDVAWGYAILDEGHKIRNPDAEVRVCCIPYLSLGLQLPVYATVKRPWANGLLKTGMNSIASVGHATCSLQTSLSRHCPAVLCCCDA